MIEACRLLWSGPPAWENPVRVSEADVDPPHLSERDMAAKWDNDIAMDWRWVIPPARPSLSELAVYDRLLGSYAPNSRILILGSTPELRDLAYFHQFHVTVVDYNKRTYNILKHEMRHPSNERLIVQDWREMDLPRRYDIVIGDLVINMMPFDDLDRFFGNVLKGLKENGIFINRTWIRIPDVYASRKTSLDQILKEHSRDRSRLPYFFSLALPLIQYYYDEGKNHINFQTLLEGLDQAFAQGLINKECLDAFRRPWHRYLMPNWIPERGVLELKLKKYFNIIEVTSGQDFFKEFCPIYALASRESAHGHN
jgi:SAM-dependent methyltransferase